MGKEEDRISHPASTSPNPFPTPASSTVFASRDGDGDESMSDIRPGSSTFSFTQDTEMTDVSFTHIRTDHDRLGRYPNGGIRDGTMGELYKLCINPYPISQPHPRDNLVGLYGLDSIAASVARKDPNTGDKINKLRKSYENHIKELKIAGEKNKSYSQKGELMDNLLMMPDEEWQNQMVFGKEMEKLKGADVLAKLDKALQMNPGRIPRDKESRFRTMVGDGSDKSKVLPAAPAVPKPQAAATQSVKAQTATRPSSPAVRPPIRPERTGAKRSYDEATFKGYGEGFVDDDDSTGAEGDGRSGSAKKKRRKEFGAGSPLGFPATGSNYQAVGRVTAGGR